MRMLQRTLLVWTSVGCSVFGILVQSLPAAAATVDTATITFDAGGNPTECLMASADDQGDVCQFVFLSGSCTPPPALVGLRTCSEDADLIEPDGETVLVQLTIEGPVSISGEFGVGALVVTGSANDDGAAWAIAGNETGFSCLTAACGAAEMMVSW